MSDTITMPPGESGSYELTRFNALRHGVLSRYILLPWESPGEYRSLLEALLAEHAPQGPTEEHLVEELAGIFWRKRRLRLAEAAAHRRGLEKALDPFRKIAKTALVHLGAEDQHEDAEEAIQASSEDPAEELADLDADEALTRRALELLNSRRNDAYEAALSTLREDTQEWWAEMLACKPEELEDDEVPYTADVEGLRHFIETEVLPWFDKRKQELANRPLIREQAFGESLDPDKLERLGRYEVHLDRKLERTLSMLIKLKELRSGPSET